MNQGFSKRTLSPIWRKVFSFFEFIVIFFLSLIFHVAALFTIINFLISPAILNSSLLAEFADISVQKTSSFLPWSLTVQEGSLSFPEADISFESFHLKLNPWALFKGMPHIKLLSLREASITVKDISKDNALLSEERKKTGKSGPADSGKRLFPEKVPRFSIGLFEIDGLEVTGEASGFSHRGFFRLSGSLESPTGRWEGINGGIFFHSKENSLVFTEEEDQRELLYNISVHAGFSQGKAAMEERIALIHPEGESRLDHRGGFLFTREHSRLSIREVGFLLNGMSLLQAEGTLVFNDQFGLESLVFSRFSSHLDLTKINAALRRYHPGLLPFDVQGYFQADGETREETVKAKITVSVPKAECEGISAQNVAFSLVLSGTPRQVKMEADAEVKSLLVSQMGSPVENVRLSAQGVLNPENMSGEAVLEDFSFSLYGGLFQLRGRSPDFDTLHMNLLMKEFTFYNYFNMPLYAKINAMAELTGSLSEGLSLYISAGAENIDYRMDFSPIMVPKVTVGGGVIISPRQKYLYCDNFFLKLGQNNRFLVNGFLEGWGEQGVNLTLSHSRVNIPELISFVPSLPEMTAEGSIDFTLDITGTLKNIQIKSDNTLSGLALFYPEKKISLSGLDGRFWLEGELDKWKAVFDCSVEEFRYGKDISVRGLAFSLPYYFGDFLPEELRQADEINFRFKEGGYQHFLIEDFKASLFAAGKTGAIKTFYSRFLDGQIGGSLKADIDTMSYAAQFNAIDLNLRKGTGRRGTSLLSMVSRIEGKSTDIKGYWDITKIDSDVLDKALISIDPDKKNPQVQNIRKKLNMVGVVPKNVLVTTSNGFVNIHPTFGFRRSNLVSFILGFLIGGLDVEPIRRIPLESILKETGVSF